MIKLINFILQLIINFMVKLQNKLSSVNKTNIISKQYSSALLKLIKGST